MAFQILYVEDDPMDVQLMREALQESAIPHALTVASNGVAALEKIRAGERLRPSWAPDLVVCDLHMPEMGGHEFLRSMKQEPLHRHIPVVIMSATHSDNEIALCYELHANCVVRKPSSFDDLLSIVLSVAKLWLATSVSPRIEA